MVTAARTPPDGLPGLAPEWSRLVDVPGIGTFHVLERPSARATTSLTVLAVHGNPTWSYLWRRLLERAPTDWRVIAIDHLGMGFSERDGRLRRLADRIDDLGALTRALGVEGPVVTVAHDWGGPISLGWALAHLPSLAGVVLTNTAVHQPEGAPAPTLIRLARSRPLLRTMTERTPTFVRGTTRLSSNMPADVAAAYATPYPDADSRRAVRDFVADIPLDPDHPSARTLDGIAEALVALADIPVFLAWGADDPVFSDRYLRDLRQRMPHANVHRYEKARHLVTEDAPTCVDDIIAWIAHVTDAPGDGPTLPAEVEAASAATDRHIGAALERRAADSSTAIADLRTGRRVSWSSLAGRSAEIAAGLLDAGVCPGDRIAVLIPPGPDLIASAYAAWRMGAVVVAVDAGLGVRGMRRALRAAQPTHAIAVSAGLALTRTIGLPGMRILAGPPSAATRAVGAHATLAAIARRGRRRLADDVVAPDDRLGRRPEASDEAVVVFTSGATGPAKGVVYTHGRLIALVDALRSSYGISSDGGRVDALVAAFAPWVVLGPALGIASAIPDMDVTDASSLTAKATARAAAAVGGTLMWASPTALRAIVDSAGSLDERGTVSLRSLRLVLAAGAAVPPELIDRTAALFPDANVATPYGMTEALPLTEGDPERVRSTGMAAGVPVGRPLPGVDIRIAALDSAGKASAKATDQPGVSGEIVVRAAWMRERYDQRWATQLRADSPVGWHRTADVGHLDDEGCLWVEGRLAHVITTADGVLTPVGPELIAQRVADVPLAACVGVGPLGTAVPVIVLQQQDSRAGLGKTSPGNIRLASTEVTCRVRDAVRAACGADVAAVLTMRALPVDIRHRSKVDRALVARLASDFLAGSSVIGQRPRRPPAAESARESRQTGGLALEGRPRRVLVTGGTGVVGAATVRALLAEGIEVTVLHRGHTPPATGDLGGATFVTGDVCDERAVRKALEGVDAVVHAAAKVTLTGAPEDFERINVGGTRCVANAAREMGVGRFVMVSSPSVAYAGSALVGASAGLPDPVHARGEYARSKARAEMLALSFDSDEMAVVAIRPHLVWGPGDTQLTMRIVERARAGRLVLIGSGAALIDTTYVDNAGSALVAAVRRAAEPDVHGGAFVVSNGQPRTVAEMLDRIARSAGQPGPRARVPVAAAMAGGRALETAWGWMGREGEPPITAFLAEQLATAHWFDQRATRSALAWAPEVGLEEGFDRLAAWLTRNEPARE